MHRRRICVLRGRQGNVEFPDWSWSTVWKKHGVVGKILMKCWIEVFPFHNDSLSPFSEFEVSWAISLCSQRCWISIASRTHLGKKPDLKKRRVNFWDKRIVCVDVRVMNQLLYWSGVKIIHLCSMIDCFLQSSLGRSSSNLLTCHLSFQKVFLYFRWEEGQTRKSLAVCF